MKLAQLFVELSLDDKASKGINSAAKSLADKLTGSAHGAATALKATAAAATAVVSAITAVGGASFNAWAEYEQLVGGVDTLFKDSSSQLQQYAQQAYLTAGLSANAYMNQATSFAGSLLQSLEGDTEAAVRYANLAMTDMSDNANKMGTNIGSIQYAYQGFAKQNFTMLSYLAA